MTSKNKEIMFELMVIIHFIVIVLLVAFCFTIFGDKQNAEQNVLQETDSLVVFKSYAPPLPPKLQ